MIGRGRWVSRAAFLLKMGEMIAHLYLKMSELTEEESEVRWEREGRTTRVTPAPSAQRRRGLV